MSAPLAGLRVLDFGHYIAGPLAGVFLADQGADVIRIVRPGAVPWDPVTDRTLARGKRAIELDLKDPDGRERALSLAREADVVLENFRPGVMERLGLGYDHVVGAGNEEVVYVSMPGFSRHDERAGMRAWDGTISAACGLFTDLSFAGEAFELPPTYTPLPLPSVYAGLWGAVAASAAVLGRASSGRGDRLEVPLMDAAMSAAAGVIFQLAGQPARYNAPPLPRRLLDAISLQRFPQPATRLIHKLFDGLMPPFFRNYRCGDGELLFLCAIDNASQIAKLLDATGLRGKAAELGFRAGDVLDIPRSGDNINAYRGASLRWTRLQRALGQRFETGTAQAWAERLATAGVPAVRQQRTSEWVAMPAMHDSGVLARASGTGEVQPAPQVDVRGREIATQAPARAQGGTQGSVPAWTEPRTFAPPDEPAAADCGLPLAGIRVLDLSNVISGPAAGRTLAELGAEVIHVSAVRPRMGPRMTMLLGMEVNQGKRSLALDLARPEGRAVLERILPATDVVLYNKLPAQAERLGVSPGQVHTINDRAVVTAVTAYSGLQQGGWEDRPAYDPVIQALSGIMRRYGGQGPPAVHGIASCIDYFTGFAAAFGAITALLARSRGATHLITRTSLARTAGWVQLPFIGTPDAGEPAGLLAQGWGSDDRLYRARDGWLHVSPREQDLAAHASDPTLWLTREISSRSVQEAVQWARSTGLSAQEVRYARRLRKDALPGEWPQSRLEPRLPSGRVLAVDHPAGEHYWVPDNTWIRPDRLPRHRLTVAPRPGQHTREILRELGYDTTEIDKMLEQQIVTEAWFHGTRYVPS